MREGNCNLGFSCFMNRQGLLSVWRNQIVCFCLYLLQSSSNRRTPKFTRELLELGLFGFDTPQPQYYSHVNILLHLHRTIFSRTLTGYLKEHFMIMITMKTELCFSSLLLFLLLYFILQGENKSLAPKNSDL